MNKITYAAIIFIIISVNPIVAQIVDLGGGVYLNRCKKRKSQTDRIIKTKNTSSNNLRRIGRLRDTVKNGRCLFSRTNVDMDI